VIALSAGVIGYLKRKLSPFEMVIMIVAGLMFIDPGTFTDIIGAILFGYLYFSQRFGFSLFKWTRRQTI
jgi:TRAP-type uncharacterized transport system fused permease subunit